MRGLFNSCLGARSCAPFQFKLDGWNDGLAAAIVGGAASLGSSAINGIAANDLNEKNMSWQYKNMHEQMNFSHNEAEIARQHQLELLNAEQGWQERMYNLYNSPSAMMRQYREAGLNPYLVDAKPSQGASMTSPAAPSTAQASAPSVGAPNTYMPDLSGIGRAGEMLLQAIGVSANASNQSAQGIHQVLENAKMMEAMNMPKEDIQRYMYSAFKEIKGANFDASRFVKQIDLDNEAQDLRNQRDLLQLELDKYYSPKERQSKLNEVDQLITESVSRIGMMANEAKLNDKKCEHIAQDMVESLSRIFKNYAEGSYADVQGLESMTFLPYIEKAMGYNVNKLELENLETYGNKGIEKFNKTMIGKGLNIIVHYLQRAFGAANVGINVGIKPHK